MPPLLVVVGEALALHDRLEAAAVRRRGAGRVGGVGGGGERIEGRAHLELASGGAVGQCQVDGEAEIVAAAAGDVAVAQEVVAADAAGPVHHGERRAHGAVGVPHLQREPVGGEAALDAAEGGGGLAAKEGAIRVVARERSAGEVVARRVAEGDDDRAVGDAHVLEQRVGDTRVADDGKLRRVDRWRGGRGRVTRRARAAAERERDESRDDRDAACAAEPTGERRRWCGRGVAMTRARRSDHETLPAVARARRRGTSRCRRRDMKKSQTRHSA